MEGYPTTFEQNKPPVFAVNFLYTVFNAVSNVGVLVQAL